MSADIIQDAIIKQLRNDSVIFAEFGKTLTGTLTFTETIATVTGVGTAFMTELLNTSSEGRPVVKQGAIRVAGSTEWYRVKSVESETSLTLYTVFAEGTEAGVVGNHVKGCKGMGRNFHWLKDLKGIRVHLMVENIDKNTITSVNQLAVYPFVMVVMFYEPDDEDAETRKVAYSIMLRKAIDRDWNLSASLPPGESIATADLKDTRHMMHETVSGGYSSATPLQIMAREAVI